MKMPRIGNEKVERVTVYLTPRNKARLASLRRGEKTKKLNEALERAFQQEERREAFDAFMRELNETKLVKPIMPSVEAVRELRKGRDHEIADSK